MPSYAGSGNNRGTGQCLGLDGRGDITVLGQFSGTLNVGPYSLTTLNNQESFLAKLGNAALATRAARSLALLPLARPRRAAATRLACWHPRAAI